MKSELDVRISIGLAFVIFFILLLWNLNDPTIGNQIFSFIGSAISGAVFLRYIFMKYLWKWKSLRGLESIHQIPFLEGVWEGINDSTGNDRTPEDRKKIPVTYKVCQPDIHTISITRISDEGRSKSFAETVLRETNGSYQLAYSYITENSAAVQPRSPMSYGTAKLHYTKGTPDILEGNYWTDQKTTGTVRLKKLS